MENTDHHIFAMLDEVYIKKFLQNCKPVRSSRECCIYRVPNNLRKLNEDAYTPRVVSIGPIHHRNDAFQTMEMYKGIYLEFFIQRTGKSIRDFINYVIGCEEEVRSCYAETFVFDNFRPMLVMDGIFILEFLLQRYLAVDHEGVNEHPLYNPIDLDYDLKLLENQLPFFFLEGLYDVAYPPSDDQPVVSFHDIVFRYFCKPDKIKNYPKVMHFTDLLRTVQLPPQTRPKLEKFSYMNKEVQCSKNATVLHEAGVKFKLSSSKCLFDINFKKGVLRIPRFEFRSTTESYIRNLIALEQCHHPYRSYICHYFFLMDSLINTAKDVDLLVEKRIIVNWLGDSDAVATLVNKLCKHVLVFSDDFYFSDLCHHLDEHCGKRRYSWKMTLKRDYLSTPWKIASTTAAIILLVLTFIQTVCSIVSLSSD